MVPQVKLGTSLILSRGDLGAGLWRTTLDGLLARWSEGLERSSGGGDIERVQGTFTLDEQGAQCVVSWTFSEARLAGVSLRPVAGRREVDLLLGWLDVAPGSLQTVGDGLYSTEVHLTRFDVDRLDGVISLYEVC